MPRPKIIYREEMHKLLWERSDHLGRIRLVQKDLAKEFGVSERRIYGETRAMREEGRIKILGGGGKGKPKYFQVTNPEEWTEASEE